MSLRSPCVGFPQSAGRPFKKHGSENSKGTVSNVWGFATEGTEIVQDGRDKEVASVPPAPELFNSNGPPTAVLSFRPKPKTISSLVEILDD